MIELKQPFIDRMRELLDNEKDFNQYLVSLETQPRKTIRCNTLKITPEELKVRLEKLNWIIKQPFSQYPEYFVIESNLLPGELGRSLEHQLGYYYVQETCSMLSLFALQLQPHDRFLDLCAAPGSKTTQAASMMKNSGLIIANEVSLGRMKILSANLQRCGVSNSIVTQQDGVRLCERLNKINFQFNKILLDAPCSGEGTIKSVPRSHQMWNPNTIYQLSKIQKRLFQNIMPLLKKEGELLYSTCTHTPEENEGVLDALMEVYPELEVIPITTLPKELKTRPGIEKWKDQTFNPQVKHAIRVYPQDNNTEGFFIAKLRWKG